MDEHFSDPSLAPPKNVVMPMAAGAPPPLVPARMINETVYCERLLYLEWAQGEFADNVFTVDGRSVHERADQPGGSLPPAKTARKKSAKAAEDQEDEGAAAPRPYEARSVWLSSEALGLTAKIDIVQGDETGRVVPIEYKRGSPPDVPEQAYLPERAQLCAQVLLLREHGYTCDTAEIYFAAARQRVQIVIDDALIAATRRAAARAREITARPVIPPPLDNSPKCHGCSLIGICLPDETNLLRRLEGKTADDDPSLAEEPDPHPARAVSSDLEGPLDVDPWGLAGVEMPADFELRRLHPARTDKLPVYVQDQGARIGLEGHTKL